MAGLINSFIRLNFQKVNNSHPNSASNNEVAKALHANALANGVGVYSRAQNAPWGYTNPVEGSGTARAFDAHSGRNPAPFLSYNYIDQLYRTNWCAARLIDVPAEDMMRKWRKFSHENPKTIKAREKVEKKLRVKKIITQAVKWADLYGGSAIVLGLDDEDDISQPLQIKRLKKGCLNFLNVVFKDQINPSTEIELNPYAGALFGKPKYYTISGSQKSRIHASRVIVFYGKELPLYASLQQIGWGDSRLMASWNVIEMAEKMWLNISQLLSKACVDTILMEGYRDLISDSPDSLFQMLGVQKAMISNYKNLILDKNDDFKRNELGSLTGLNDIMLKYLQMVGASGGMPLTKFLGDSVSGLAATGDNEIIQYYDTLATKRDDVDPNLEHLDRIIEMSTFGELKEIDYEWVPLYEVSASQKAEIENKRANTDKTYLEIGVVDEVLIAKNLRKNNTYESLDEDYIDELEKNIIDREESPDFGEDESEINPKALSTDKKLIDASDALSKP